MIFKMSSTAIVLVVLMLTSLVKGIPAGCKVLHRAIDGCQGSDGMSIEHCLSVGTTPLDLNDETNGAAFEERIQRSTHNQKSYDTYLNGVKACAEKGTFNAILECRYNSTRIFAEALGCLN